MLQTGIYGGNDPNNVASYNTWAGKSADNVLVFLNQNSWQAFDSSISYSVDMWKGSSSDPIYSVPLTVTGTSLEQTASGSYNDHYLNAAQSMAAASDTNQPIYVRLGWEFNGDWQPWAAAGHEAAFITTYQNAAQTFQSVSSKFKFVWDMNIDGGNMDPSKAYPGDNYVDVIGSDIYYNHQWDSSDPISAFNHKVSTDYGLNWQSNFAQAHDKPTAISEWGVSSNNDGPYVQSMFKWMTDHDMIYENYWESNGAYPGELHNGQYPKAGAAFKAAIANLSPPPDPGNHGGGTPVNGGSASTDPGAASGSDKPTPDPGNHGGGTPVNGGSASTDPGAASGSDKPTPSPASINPNAAQTAGPARCYVSGTRIRVLRALTIQDVPVERLCVGDLVITAAGKPRPIRWIGNRSYVGLTAPKHDRPVRIKARALSDGIPTRDLLVSPDHALMVDGLFIAAGHLVNGTSITRGEVVQDLTYWHVELDGHDLLLAENTPAESFLPAPGLRAGFDGVHALDAGAAPMSYAPRTELGSELAALRGRLARRAVSSGDTAELGPVRAWLDRCVVGGDGLLHVAGWALDANQPDAPVCLDILVDGTIVALAVASEYRADIAAAGVGNGRHGFDLGLAVPLVSGVPHLIDVRRSADGTLVCAKQVDAAGAWTALLAA
ncbi:Hint domain-containing protein [Methylobacterium longum]|uniref:Hint domain-containing protein n=1 Tax=Methylobacterium longum TaxID=767694 RepID=A0ABT8APB8_9HYPH|nr:Hint domain-containing protein [Methylobacterium longum]MDN3571306.1 Hint domain-containing protein [Methylobacterium longum]GJE09158.1 hypothetical protein FOHLNKBM_0178 [Methylobacterium longum]